jgi:putative glutamine amidotransferase
MTPPSPTGSECVALSDSNLQGGSRPIIGLTTYLEQSQTGVWDVPASFLPKVYFEAVNRAGGIAVLLPPQPINDESAARILERLDGLIITGGKDVNPARYGQEQHPTTDTPRLDRDEFEDTLLRVAIEKELPFLGICRGLQVLNVALGGTLHQHLPEVIGSTRYNLGEGNFAVNEVEVAPGTKIAELLAGSDTVTVKSYHHQAIDEVAPGLRVTATTDDGIVQAVEIDSMPFGVAVQWHPEETPDDLRLFEGLVAAARQNSHQRDALQRETQQRDAQRSASSRKANQ